MRDFIVRIRALWRKLRSVPVASETIHSVTTRSECLDEMASEIAKPGMVGRSRPPYPAQSTREVTGRVVRS